MANNHGILIFLFVLLSLFAAGNGQPSPFPDIRGVCGESGGSSSVVFGCSFNNEVVSLRCSFDGGAEEDCSLPLELSIDRFGPGQHTVVLTAIDVFRQTFSIELPFSFSASPPSEVTQLHVVRVTSISIEISWSPPENDGGSPVTSYHIEADGRSIELGPDARRYILTGLTPETSYEVGVQAANSGGKGLASGLQATTGQGFFPSPVNNLAVSRVTSSSITITWSPPDSDGGSPVTGYIVQLVDFRSPPSPFGLGPDATSYEVEGLLPQRSYLLLVRAINSVGGGPQDGILGTTTASS